MGKQKTYKLNLETLLYEKCTESPKERFWKVFFGFLISVVLSVGYLLVYTLVLDQELPKTVLLKKANDTWKSRLSIINRHLDTYEHLLDGLEVRDEGVYRNIFGMNTIAPEIRDAGFGGVNRYSYLDNISDNSLLKTTTIRLDILTKKAFIQSKSFDEIAAISKRAGEIASCVPAVSPIVTDDTKYRLSSRFGYRTDPVRGGSAFHAGMDFSMKQGTPIYATGDGTVVFAKYEMFGYGNSIVIDHGFGYKTRYAHLKTIYVTEGMKIKRGECIGESGNSGKSTGPHLHYEVIYKGSNINPANFLDLEMPKLEYLEMVKLAEEQSPNHIIKPHTRIKF